MRSNLSTKQMRSTIFRSINPFATDGTQKYRFENFLIFIWKGRGAQIPMGDATMIAFAG